tara:strand:+ start:14079 stop:14711 length:633 start_codon:yes stop_codon:yes gene_type:complete
MIKVEMIDKMGSDLSVVNAARVSYAKVKNEFEDKDTKLIGYLAKHGHWSPFAHASISFRIKAPVFVARQLVKHQVGLSWNEVSRRYVSYEPELYKIDEWRGKPVNSKQGSSGTIKLSELAEVTYSEMMDGLKILYNQLLSEGVAPEQARAVLPQSMMTEWIWSGTLYAFARVCDLRCKPDVQKETREVAEFIDSYSLFHFPISWNALRPR